MYVTRLSPALGAVVALTACARAPSPLAPALHGSIGTPNCGVLVEGREVAREGEGLRWLRGNDRHWAVPRFAGAIERAAARVTHERPGARLQVGDLSTPRGGGPLAPHFSHRSGMDADLLFYVTTVEGVPVDSPGFIHFGADGLARDAAHDRWLRLDVDRQWRFVRALLEDRDARVQWIFVSQVVQAMLLDWALARGDSPVTIERAERVMLEPHPGGVHDDHLHVRTTCSPEETLAGCEPVGPQRPWLAYDFPPPDDRDEDLVIALFQPLAPLPPPAPTDLPTAAGASAARAKSGP
jgi:penicillin-insensitive murein endopeptidase